MWSEEETDILLRGIQKHGKDYDKLTELFCGTRSRTQVARKCMNLKKLFRRNKSAEGAHLLWILEKHLPRASDYLLHHGSKHAGKINNPDSFG